MADLAPVEEQRSDVVGGAVDGDVDGDGDVNLDVLVPLAGQGNSEGLRVSGHVAALRHVQLRRPEGIGVRHVHGDVVRQLKP